MIQRTSRYAARPTTEVAAQPVDAAFPLACAALAFGVMAGVALAGIVIPIVTQTVVSAVARIVTGT